MTANELRHHFNTTFGLGEWPKTFEVDAETYANCCQTVFNDLMTKPGFLFGEWTIVHLSLGPYNGIIFKDVELILKKANEHKSNT
jgi:hypothetical protein